MGWKSVGENVHFLDLEKLIRDDHCVYTVYYSFRYAYRKCASSICVGNLFFDISPCASNLGNG